MRKSITLNLPYELPESQWEKVAAVYQQMDGWCAAAEEPCWFGTEQDDEYLVASLEPSGLLIEGEVDELLWQGWITKLCAKLTLAIGREIYDAEM